MFIENEAANIVIILVKKIITTKNFELIEVIPETKQRMSSGKNGNKNIKVKSMLFEMAKDKKLVEELDNTKEYIKHIGSFVSKTIKQNKLKVLFNTMHGVTGECISLLAKNYNLAKYEIINDESDPYFNHKLPSPAENTLEEFKKAVAEKYGNDYGSYAIAIEVFEKMKDKN